MPRASLKKTGQSNSSTAANAAADLYRSASSKAISKELERIDQLFYAYATISSGIIDPDGIEKLCSDLEVDYTDVRVLVLAWKMQAEKQGYFTLEEWRRCLKPLRVDTIAKLKKALPELENEVRRTSNFVNFYSYAFRYCLTEEKQKNIDIESVCQLLDIVLGSIFRAQVDYLIEFLNVQTDYKVINMDQWMGFYRFCNEWGLEELKFTTVPGKKSNLLFTPLEVDKMENMESNVVRFHISFPDLSNYDEDHAWPLILDNFVEWMKEKQN